MLTKTFDEVSVQDITDLATVNRATFYDHYTDKFALLDAMVGGGFHKLLHDRAVTFDGTCPSAAGAVIQATCDYLTQMDAGDGTCQRQSAFQPLVDAAIVRAIGRVLAGGFPTEAGGVRALPRVSNAMIVAAASWGIYGAVREWFRTDERVPAEEMVQSVLGLVVPLLTASGAPVALHA